MPFDILLFPLVGGYYLYATLETRHKYIQLRFDGQKLLFNSAIAGVILISISLLITISLSILFPDQMNQLKGLLPIQKPFLGTSFLSFLLAVIIAKVGNRFRKRTTYILKAIQVIGNELEMLIKTSFEEESLLLISLRNDKFYIGWATSLPIPTQSKYISIIPAYSGYRDGSSKELNFTTQYLEVYAQYIAEGQITAIDDLGVNLVINLDDVVTVSHFDIETFERFGNLNSQFKGKSTK